MSDEPYADDEDFDDDLPCSMCGGEGGFIGDELPSFSFGWHDPDGYYDCPSCHGSGSRRDMTFW